MISEVIAHVQLKLWGTPAPIASMLWNMSSIMKVIPLSSVTQMKSNMRWIHSNTEFKKMYMPSVEWIPLWLVTMKMMTQLNTISSCTNVSNIETECTGIVSVCNTDVSHQKRIDFYLAKFPKAFIEINVIRMAKHCDVLLL